MKLINKLITWLDLENDRCFEKSKRVDGKCYGVVGGSKWTTDNLAEKCIDCKHLTFICNTNIYKCKNQYWRRSYE